MWRLTITDEETTTATVSKLARKFGLTVERRNRISVEGSGYLDTAKPDIEPAETRAADPSPSGSALARACRELMASLWQECWVYG